MAIDRIYQTAREEVKGFTFDRTVAEVFDDMIARSVPSYWQVQEITAKLAAAAVGVQGAIYDLGCASGTTLVVLAKHVRDAGVRIIGIDSSEAMLESCREKLAQYDLSDRVELRCEDLSKSILDGASVVILNYTLQFVEPVRRLPLLSRLKQSMRAGGLLILAEKVVHRDDLVKDFIINLHHDFKRANSYSDLEIAQKRDSLENVLVPFTLDDNLTLLRDAGFTSPEVLLKSYNFACISARA